MNRQESMNYVIFDFIFDYMYNIVIFRPAFSYIQ